MCPNPFRSPCLSSPPPLLLYSSKTSARSARLDSRSRGRPQPSPGIHVDDTGLSVVHLLLLKITTIINIIEKKKIMDFGYPRNLWPEILKLYITQLIGFVLRYPEDVPTGRTVVVVSLGVIAGVSHVEGQSCF
ncbi:uncharacterized protein LOC109705761 isoform X1 [Ananas comosus]|uniref:Uncharacterized protein LOC109705761 isoform X1 n=1 Tax=Ananas comosus TaxID=4615 RepID=A0A6P5EL42_ANACO|nr:uncharacterized protein LOC109705761 isoform X1 [Ananas comosus]